MTARVKAFAAFWYDFVVGDDWRVAQLPFSLWRATRNK